jgi:hypothetical protein
MASRAENSGIAVLCGSARTRQLVYGLCAGMLGCDS